MDANADKGFLVGRKCTDSFDLVLKALKKKLQLLNGEEYKYFKWNCLFIFSDIYAEDRMILNAIGDMQKSQINMEKQFYKVFVLVPGYCYSLNLDTSSHQVYPIESAVQVSQATKARELVEKYEKI